MDIGGLQHIFVSNMDMSAAITLYTNAFAIWDQSRNEASGTFDIACFHKIGSEIIIFSEVKL